MEIKRLEKNQKRVIEVFNSEIKLLQSAFNEMRAIYKPQIENQKNEKKREFISLQEFFIILKRASKSDLEIKNTILNCVKNGDKRFIYNKNSKKLLILNDSFEDLLWRDAKSTPSQIPNHNTKKGALLYSYPGALSLEMLEKV